MSISLTRILQQITGLNTFFAGPNASRDNGVVLADTASVTWTTDGQGNIIATAAGGATFPTATAAGQVLTSTAPGTNYTAQTPAPSGMTLIASQTLGTASGSVTFSSIPQTFKNLKLVFTATSNAGNTFLVPMFFNGDTTTDYTYAYTQSNVGTPGSYYSASFAGALIGVLLGGGDFAFSGYADILSYATAIAQKPAFANSLTGFGYQFSGQSLWTNAAAITSLQISGNGANFDAGSTFELYGY